MASVQHRNSAAEIVFRNFPHRLFVHIEHKIMFHKHLTMAQSHLQIGHSTYKRVDTKSINKSKMLHFELFPLQVRQERSIVHVKYGRIGIFSSKIAPKTCPIYSQADDFHIVSEF
jgi:hypothetical protein